MGFRAGGGSARTTVVTGLTCALPVSFSFAEDGQDRRRWPTYFRGHLRNFGHLRRHCSFVSFSLAVVPNLLTDPRHPHAKPRDPGTIPIPNREYLVLTESPRTCVRFPHWIFKMRDHGCWVLREKARPLPCERRYYGRSNQFRKGVSVQVLSSASVTWGKQ